MTYYVYKITNLINGKIYIGKTSDLDRRWRSHKNLALKNEKHFYLHNALSKYGSENFMFEELFSCSNEEKAYDKEAELISYYNSNIEDFGYNMTVGGKGIMSGKPVSLEARRKISEYQKNRERTFNIEITDEFRAKMSELSKYNRNILTIEQKKEIMSLFNSGKYTKKQIANKLGIKYESVRYVTTYHKKGFKSDEEKRKNRSDAKKGRTLSSEIRRKISESLTGKSISKDIREKISKALTGRNLSQDTKDRIAATLSGKENYVEIKRDIIRLFQTGEYSKIELARKFGLNRKVVEKILKDRNNHGS